MDGKRIGLMLNRGVAGAGAKRLLSELLILQLV